MFSKLFNFVFVLAIVLFGFGTLTTNAMEGYGGGAPACTMYANPSTIDYNGGMYLNWDVNENVTYALLHPKGSYSWTMEVSPTDGSWWMSGLRNTRDYTLTVYNENEESADCDAHITVLDAPPAELTCNMSAVPQNIHSGDNASIVWSTTGNVVSGELRKEGSSQVIEYVNPNGSWSFNDVTRDANYTIVFKDVSNNTVTCEASIDVLEDTENIPAEAPSCEMHANLQGSSATLIWHNSPSVVSAEIVGVSPSVSPDTGWFWINDANQPTYTMKVKNVDGVEATCVANIN